MSEVVKKKKWAVIDTFTSAQINVVNAEKSKPQFDTWREYSREAYNVMVNSALSGFYNVLVLGREGTGKSYAIKGLNPDEGIWFHCDNKAITFKGGKEKYEHNKNYYTYYVEGGQKHFLTLPKIYANLSKRIARGEFVEEPVLFIIGHVEIIKQPHGEVREGMKLIGNMARNHNIEGQVSLTLYSNVDWSTGEAQHRFDTQNSGLNTCRSPEGMFETRFIPNNFQIVLDAIENY